MGQFEYLFTKLDENMFANCLNLLANVFLSVDVLSVSLSKYGKIWIDYLILIISLQLSQLRDAVRDVSFLSYKEILHFDVIFSFKEKPFVFHELVKCCYEIILKD
jgi:hypothetical protein